MGVKTTAAAMGISVLVPHKAEKNPRQDSTVTLCAMLSRQQRSFLLQQKETNTETTARYYAGTWTTQRRWDVFIKSLPSELMEPCGRRGGKSVRARRHGRHQETRVL